MPGSYWYTLRGIAVYTILVGRPLSAVVNKAVADLDGDGVPEVVIQSAFAMQAVNSEGMNWIARSGGDGISSGGSDLIVENTIRSSSGDAVDFAASTTSGYAENATSATSGAEVAGAGVLGLGDAADVGIGGVLGRQELADQDRLVVVDAVDLEVLAALELGRRLATRRLRTGDAIRGPADVHRHFHARLRDAPHERFLVLLLDGRHRVLREVTASQGTLTASLVHPREVFRPALREAAAAVILVHNHPSGDPTPSPADREVTRQLVEAGRVLGIPVRDHVIVGNGRYVSFLDLGHIPALGR